MTDSNGDMVNKYAYDEFGNLLNSVEAVWNPFLYVGQYGVMDEGDGRGGNGLLYMRARYYDPVVGRFISKDPIGYWGGINLYAYVNNNPATFIDPSGEFAEAAAVALTGIGIGTGTLVGLGAAGALAICYGIPECRNYINCFAELLRDLSTCIGKGILPTGDQTKTEHCFRRASINYRACIRGWGCKPFPNVYPRWVPWSRENAQSKKAVFI
jgi:RHS repeat-associated protein